MNPSSGATLLESHDCAHGPPYAFAANVAVATIAQTCIDGASNEKRAGSGLATVRRVNGRSVVVRQVANSPLRLLAPRGCPGQAAWIFTSTFGGGLLGGDHIDLAIRAERGSTVLLGTQASTKVYGANASRSARQSLNVDLDAEATAIVLPDPVTCFAGASYRQDVTVQLGPGASVVILDWFTSGRKARGERWAFGRYESRLELRAEQRTLFRDALVLDQKDGPLAGNARMGRCDCYATVLLAGPRLKTAAADLLAWTAARPAEPADGLAFSASPAAADGAVLRVAGAGTEQVSRWLRERLGFVVGLLDGDPWSRKT